MRSLYLLQPLFLVAFYGSIINATATDIEHWDGTTWSIVPSPNAEMGASATNLLNGVATLSASDAWAVGMASADQNAPAYALTEHWDGKRWSIVNIFLA